MVLLICLVGAFIGYQIYTSGSLPLLGGGVAMSTPGPSVAAQQAPTAAQPAPTVGGSPAATAIFTQTQQIREDDVGPAVYAPSGDLLAAGLGSTIQLRTGENLDQGALLKGHTGSISSLAFSPDGSTLASGAQDENDIILWDMASSQELRRLTGHSGWIRSLEFSPDGSILASGSTDNTVRLWDVSSGLALGVLEGHSDFLGGVAFSPDGASLASVSRDGKVIVWDVAARQPRADFSYTAPTDPETGNPYWLTGVDYSPDGKSVAVGSVSSIIYVLDAANGQLQRELKGHEDWVVIRGVSYSPDGRTLASASLDGTVRLWSPLTGTERASLTLRHSRLLGLSWASDSQHLVAASDTTGALMVWNTQTRQLERTAQITQGVVTTLVYSEGGAVLGSGGASGTVRLHIFPNDREVSIPGGLPTSQYIGFVGDTHLAAISDSGEVVIIDLTGQDRNRQLQGLTGVAVSLVVSPDQTLVAAGDDQGNVAIWEASSQKLLRTVRGLNGPAFMLAFNPDGSRLSAATNLDSGSAQIVVWDVQSGSRQATINDPQSQITSLEMPPGGDTVASASSNGALTLWSAADGSTISTITAPESDRWFTGFAFSPDGSLLVTGSSVGNISFWDPRSGTQLSSISLGTGSVMSVAFRPDGQQIAVCTFNGGIYLFEPVK